MILFPLYIDPGTGSALFSIIIGLVAVVIFAFQAFYLKIKLFLTGGKVKQGVKNKFVIYAEDKRYWLYFEPILKEFEDKKIEVLYLTQSQDDPVFSLNYGFIKSKFIGTGNKAFAYLNFLQAEIVLATTPHLDVLQWKRSKSVKHYCHLIHAVGGSMLYRLYGLDYYDSILLSGESEIPEIRYLEKIRNLPEKQLIITGNTFFDNCLEKIKQIPKEENHPFTVLISPTWGPSGLLSVYEEKLIEPLLKTEWRIIIRPHPQSATKEKAMLDNLADKYKNYKNIEWDYNNENIFTLAKSDIMISDYSGIIFDYVFLFNKPVIMNISNIDLRIYDAYKLKEEPSYLKNLRKIAVELDKNNLDNITQIIQDVIQNKELENIRQEIKKQMWQFQEESAKRIVNYLIETAERSSN